MKHIWILSLILVFSGCIKTINEQGYKIPEIDISKLKLGESTKSDVFILLGSPSTTSNFGDETWYYINKKYESVAFLDTKDLEQKVISFRFDNNGVLQKIEDFDLNDKQQIAIKSDKTPTEGNRMTIFEQMLSNLGRFNQSRSKPGISKP